LPTSQATDEKKEKKGRKTKWGREEKLSKMSLQKSGQGHGGLGPTEVRTLSKTKINRTKPPTELKEKEMPPIPIKEGSEGNR